MMGLGKRVTAALLLIGVLMGCGGGGGGGGGGDSTILTPNQLYASRCGTPVDGALVNPATNDHAEAVNVQAVTSDTLIVTRLEGSQAGATQLVKLQGITGDGGSSGVNVINGLLAGGPAALVLPGSDCAVTADGGGQGVAAQLFTLGGESINERLLSEGAVRTAVDVCGSELLSGCYQTIEAEAISPKRIHDFLWKPVSESNGNLAVLVDPADITVVVTGAVSDTLINTGPSNGRGTTARSGRFSGGEFGNNVLVEFFDENGKRVLVNNGDRAIVIGVGSQRVRLFF